MHYHAHYFSMSHGNNVDLNFSHVNVKQSSAQLPRPLTFCEHTIEKEDTNEWKHAYMMHAHTSGGSRILGKRFP